VVADPGIAALARRYGLAGAFGTLMGSWNDRVPSPASHNNADAASW